MKRIFILFLFVFFVQSGCFAETETAVLDKDAPQIERGQPNVIFDSVGNILSIPKKIILLNQNIDTHNVSPKTEQYISEFIQDNPEAMKDVKVRINQWAPIRELKRLTKNKQISFWWRIFPGIPATLWASLTGRLLGGDNYNPYTNTISIYSDDPSIVLHEAGHAKDFMSKVGGVESDAYAVGRIFPPVTLYQEFTASDHAIEYLKRKKDTKEELKSYSKLYPAFGTYVGSYSGFQYGDIGGAFVGHGVGLWKRYERNLYIDNVTMGEVCINLKSDALAVALLSSERENNNALSKMIYATQIKFDGVR